MWLDRQKRTLAYALHTEKPETVNEQAPTFPPTSLKLQTYPYIAPNETEPGEGLGPAGDNNMLLYLQMTDHRHFPDIRLLEYSGNYVSPGMNGTICIGRDIIWDSYLLRHYPSLLLSLFNAYTYAWVASASIPDIIAERWVIALGDATHASDPKFYSWNQSASDPLTWTWAPSKEEQKYNNTLKTDGGWNKLSIDCRCALVDMILDVQVGSICNIGCSGTTSNTLSLVPGTANINASGNTNITIICQSVGTIWPANWEYDYT